MNLVLVGFMGVGKTSVGKRLASRLGRPFIDTDALIEKSRSMTIREIFEKYGERSFRKAEKEVVALVSKLRHCVIATGGGVVLDPVNVARLKKHGLLIHLSLPLQVICERMQDEAHRPLFQKEDHAFKKFFQTREVLYRSSCDVRVDRRGIDVEGTVEGILEILSLSPQEEHIMSNCLGEKLRILTFGESHGKAVGVVMDGVKPGLDFDAETIQKELDRRRPGQSRFVSPRVENDQVEILSGVFEGKTLGTPICLVIRNQGHDSSAYDQLKDLFRPGHAGYTTLKKYGIRDHRGGGRSSARETVGRVAAGAFARRELAKEGIRIIAYTSEIDGIKARRIDIDEIEKNPLRCPDRNAARRMERRILSVKKEGDSLGGKVEVLARNVPPGLGDPVFKKLDAEIAGALMSIGGVKAVEIGEGVKAARMKGSDHNDPMDRNGFKSNHSGGILGGISTGQEIRVRMAVKPTPSIEKLQETIDMDGNEKRISIRGRHDPCICPRIVPVAEAMMALVLYDALLRQRDIEGTESSLNQLRNEIDRLDHQVVELLSIRRKVSLCVGQYKRERGIQIRDPHREKKLLDQRIEWGRKSGVDESLVRKIFDAILADSRKIQAV